MMTAMAVLVFGGALALSAFVLATTIGSSFDRIVDALSGRAQPRFEPLAALVRAERRIAVRRWAAVAPGRPMLRTREAA